MTKSIYDDEYRAIISQIIARRKAMGLKQEDVARAIGVDRTVITKIETFIRRVDVIEMKHLCQALKLNLKDLL